MKISKLMEKTVLRIDEDATIQQAAERMGQNHVGSLVVAKGTEDVGIVTERDIMSKVIAEKRDLDEMHVKDVMSTPLVTIDQDTEGEHVIKVMAEQGIHRVLVTDGDHIVGVFSTSDITKLALMH